MKQKECAEMTGYVYFIEDTTGLVKIGVAKDPEKRLKELQTASPTKLKLLAAVECEKPFKLEKDLHRDYKKSRVNGEWFQMDSEQAKAIADGLNRKACNNCGNPPFHYFGISSDWFKQNANFSLLSKCPSHLAFYHGKPNYETGMEIIEDMPNVHRIVLQMMNANKAEVLEGE